MASRIYNEKPHSNGAHAGGSPSAPPMSPAPEGLPQHMGSTPVSTISMPHASMPSSAGATRAPFASPPSAPRSAPTNGHAGEYSDAPQKSVAPPQFAHWPPAGIPTQSQPTAFATSMPESAAVPGPLANPPVSSDSAAGISAFVAQIRQSHVPGRESWVERSGQR